MAINFKNVGKKFKQIYEVELDRAKNLKKPEFGFKTPLTLGSDFFQRHTEISEYISDNLANLVLTNQTDKKKQPLETSQKVGRNDKCPCGSGKKYKHCCGSV